MTAVDQAGNSVARYRITGEDFEPRQNTVEIAVRPGRQLTDDLVLVIAISAPWLGSSFPPRSENNPDCAL